MFFLVVPRFFGCCCLAPSRFRYHGLYRRGAAARRNCREICGRCGQDFHLGFAPLFCLLNWLDGSVFLLVSFVDDDDQGLEGDDDLHLVFPFACLRAAASLKPTCLVIRVQGGEKCTSRCFHAFQVVNAERLLPTHFMLLFWVFNSSCIIYMVLLQ